MADVVVVESPAKAKTINKYLGSNYTVLASYGHVRDLPSKDGSVRPDSDFEMDWEVDSKSQKHIKDIAEAVKKADHLYLATDPDREGEAISWHVQQVLTEKKLLDNVDVKRVVFNEITKNAKNDHFLMVHYRKVVHENFFRVFKNIILVKGLFKTIRFINRTNSRPIWTPADEE